MRRSLELIGKAGQEFFADIERGREAFTRSAATK